ncbi:MAG: hypothetical protein U0235_32455 [Polyangiaceae bacterium]
MLSRTAPSHAVSLLLLAAIACGGDGTSSSSPQAGPAGSSAGSRDSDTSGDAASTSASGDGGTTPTGAAGEHDSTFGQSGVLKSDYYALDVVAPPLAMGENARVYLGSYKQNRRGVGSLSPQGVLEPAAFLMPGSNWATDFAPTVLGVADSKLYVAATLPSQHRMAVARAAGGAFDTTFGTDGLALIPEPKEPFAGHWGTVPADLAVHDGYTYALLAFVSNTPDKYAFGVARLTPQGAPDSTFGTSGVSVIDTSPNMTSVFKLRVDDGGRIYVAASTTGAGPRVVRLTQSGGLDTTYGGGGFSDPALGSGGMHGFELDAVGRVHLATTRNGQAIAARLNESGNLDPTFGAGGVATSGMSGSKGRGLVVTPDGKVVLGCIVTGATDDLGLVRFDDKGSLDASFGSGGSVVLERPGDQQLIAGPCSTIPKDAWLS